MPKATKICKVCGKEYEYCHTFKKLDTFRYQDVACCPEHAAIYFAEVDAARAASLKVDDEEKVVKTSAGKSKASTKRTGKKSVSNLSDNATDSKE